jgi:hypothetical protein
MRPVYENETVRQQITKGMDALEMSRESHFFLKVNYSVLRKIFDMGGGTGGRGAGKKSVITTTQQQQIFANCQLLITSIYLSHSNILYYFMLCIYYLLPRHNTYELAHVN